MTCPADAYRGKKMPPWRSLSQMRIWRLLRREGQLAPREIRGRLGMGEQATKFLLMALVEKGAVAGTGTNGNRRYTATKQRPVDMRGKSLGSKAALDAIHARGREYVDRVYLGRPYVPRPKHHLEQAMGFGV